MTVDIKTKKDQENQGKICLNFDDALAETGYGKYNILILLFSSLILHGMAFETLGPSYIIPSAQCDLKLSVTQKGWVAAIPFISIILTSHIWGYLADTKGRKKILIISMCISFVFSILSSFASDLITFALLRFITGCFVAAPPSIIYVYLGEMCPLKHRDKSIFLANTAVALATGIIPLIAMGILSLDFNIYIGFLNIVFRPWRFLMIVFASPFIIASILFIWLPESPKFLYTKNKYNESLEILKKMYTINTNRDPLTYPVIDVRREELNKIQERSFWNDLWNQTIPLFKPPYLIYMLSTSYLQFVLFSGSNGFYLWFPALVNVIFNSNNSTKYSNLCGILSHMNKDTHYNNITIESVNTCDDSLNSESFYIVIILAMVLTTIGLIFVVIMNFIDKKIILICNLIIASGSGLILHWISNTTVAIILFSILQLTGITIGFVSGFIVEIFPTNYRAMAVSMGFIFARLGSIFGANIIGYLIDTKCPVTFFLFSTMLIIGACVCYILPAKSIGIKKNNNVK